MAAPERCTICRHTNSEQINREIIAGMSVRKIADRYNLSKSTVQRHKVVCMARDFKNFIKESEAELTAAEAREMRALALMKGERTRQLLSGKALLDHLDSIMEDAERIQHLAEEGESYSTSLSAMNTKLKALDSFTKIAAEAREREKLDIQKQREEWSKLKTEVILPVLREYQGAEEKFIERLTGRGFTTFT